MADHHPHPPPLRRLLSLLRPEAPDLWVVVVFALGVGVFTLATPVAANAVVNTVALGTVRQQLVVLCAALFVALALAGALQFLQTVVVESIQRRVFVRVAADLAARLPRVDVRAFDRQNGPELVNRFFDVLTVQKAAATLLLDGVTIALQLVIGLSLLAYYDRLLLGLDLMLVLALVLLVTVVGWGATDTAIRESVAKYRVAGWMEELARHPLAFKVGGGGPLAAAEADARTQEYLLARAAHFRILMRQLGFSLLLQAMANVILLGVGGYLVGEGLLLLGELVAAEIVLALVVATFAKLHKQLEAFYDLLAATDKLGHLIDLPLEPAGGVALGATAAGAAVTVHGVGYHYPGGRRPALSGVSFALAPGERVALVGPHGCGKSTLTDLLYGLRRPDAGWVEVDGHDLRELELTAYRSQVALVARPEIFEGSVLENVRTGRAGVGVAGVRAALERVGLLAAVMDLPDGLDTPLWPGGAPLSLGQANRLVLARALAGRPRLLVLDETLDQLDAVTCETVLGPDNPATVLVVTHSDDVARRCGRVVSLGAAV